MSRGAAAPGPWPQRPQAFAPAVVRWQRQSGRHDLPWQGTRDPYRVWLSEVMLQQTQVATVLRYFGRFVERFPDVHALAAAPLDEVLAAWSGLGYYSRARNLWRCAQAVVQQHGGRFPGNAAQLAELPGIGRSTAAAIAAFCYAERAAILDGNVKRVLARAFGFGADLARPAEVSRLWELADSILPRRGIEAYTQGLMDLGATVCTLRLPRCAACPLARGCVAYLDGEPARCPRRTRVARRGRRDSLWLWLAHGDRVWLVRRPDQGVWAGLWCLPLLDERAALDALADGWPGTAEVLEPIEHALTHFDWVLRPVRWTLPTRLSRARLEAVEARLPSGRWCTLAESAALGLPAPLRRLLHGA